MAPEMIAKDFLVLGTIEKKIWKQRLGSPGTPIAEMLKHLADFKHHYNLKYKAGGWYLSLRSPGETKPKLYVTTRPREAAHQRCRS
jgi:hypothetical protein